jgi:hypothetical protein
MGQRLKTATWSRLRWSALALCLELIQASPATSEIRRALLSVEGLKVGTTESIRAFHIETWGVEFLAVCHVPPSWALKSEKFEDPEGYFDGHSDTHGEPLRQITDMYLIDVYDYQPLREGDVPASFAGWVVVGRVQPFDGGTRRKQTLTANNFHLRDAPRCPDAPPAQP